MQEGNTGAIRYLSQQQRKLGNEDSFSAIEDKKAEVQKSGSQNGEFYEVLFKVFSPNHQIWTAGGAAREDSEELDLLSKVGDDSSC